MFIRDEEKEDRKDALKKIIDMMKGRKVDRLKSLKKKPGLEVELDTQGEEEDPEELDSGMPRDEAEPSDEEKAKIAELYHKYCE